MVLVPLGSEQRPLRVAIIGAGPAGFFAAAALLRQKHIEVRVDLFDKLPVPYGLVRYGVAPDHPEIKRVRNKYAKTAADHRVRFFGNVGFGSDITHDEIRAHYDQVCYAVGAQTARSLAIPGEQLAGSASATEFVAWYNGHPDYRDRVFDLSHDTAVVIGMGNVAMDTARVLAKSVDELSKTDIADHALAQLAESQIQNIYVLGRRGPVQAKFTTPELKEFGDLVLADPVIDSGELAIDELSAASLDADKTAQRNMQVLEEYAGRGRSDKPRRVVFKFCVSPVEILASDERVSGIKLVRNTLVAGESGYLNAQPTEVFESISCGLVLRSVGYKSVPLAGVPYEPRTGTIPNTGGRITDAQGNQIRGEYVAGWAKRGPSGVIGTNKADAAETVQSMLADLSGLEPAPKGSNAEAIVNLLDGKQVRWLSFADWQRVDAAEQARGNAQGRPRVKYVDREELLEIAGR